jgi:hypothetical protein
VGETELQKKEKTETKTEIIMRETDHRIERRKNGNRYTGWR